MQLSFSFFRGFAILLFCLLISVVSAQAARDQTQQLQEAFSEQARKQTEVIIMKLRSEALEAKQRSDTTLASSVWESAFTRKRDNLLALEGEVDGFLSGISSIAEPLRLELPGIIEATRRLMALNESSQDNPVFQKVLFLRALQVSKSLGRQIRPLETVQGFVLRANDAVLQLRQSLDEEAAGSKEAEFALQRMLLLDEKIHKLKTGVENELDEAQALQQRLSFIQNDILGDLLPSWSNYYLANPSHIFDVQAWQNIDQWWDQMLFSMPLRLSIEFPPTSEAWQGAGLNFINTLFLAVILLSFARFRLRIFMEQGESTPAANSFILKSLACFLLGVAVIVASFGSVEEQYRALLTVGSMIIIWSEVWLVWGVRQRKEAQISIPPLWPIAVTSVIGITLSYPNFPVIILSILWCVFVILVLVCCRSSCNQKQLLPLEKGIFQVQQVGLYLSIAVAIAGWGRLAILLVTVINCLCISVQLIVGIIQVGRNFDDNGASVVSGLISAFIAPFILFLIIGSMLLWLMAMPGGTLIAWHYLGTGMRVGQVSFSLLNIFLLLSLFYVTRAAIAFFRNLLIQWKELSHGVDSTLIHPMQTGIAYGLWTLFVLFALHILGFEIENLAVIAGGLSVGIGFGMQAIVNNFLSGLILIFSRTLHEGDVINVGSLQGTVLKISVRATTVKTHDNAIIYVPNSEFVSNPLINWTRNGKYIRRELRVGVAYGTDPKLVEKLLLQVALSVDRVSRIHKSDVIFCEFSDSTLNFTLRFWGEFHQIIELASEMRHKIAAAFAAEHITIAFPQLDVHIIPPAKEI